MRGFNIIARGNHDAAENAAIIYLHLHGMLQTGTGRCAQVAEPFLHKHTRIRQRLLKRLVGTAAALP